MKECNRCNSVISDSDMMAWKCVECGKVFKVKLSKLENLKRQKNKPENAGKTLLKCPACGIGIDDENEKIACKCSSCGNVMRGNLSYFTDEFAEEKDVIVPNTKSNLIKCPECGEEIISTIVVCPQCGYRISNQSKIPNVKKDFSRVKKKKLVGVILLLVAFASLFIFLSQKIEHSSNEKNSNTINTTNISNATNTPNANVQVLSEEEKLQRDSKDEKIIDVFRNLEWVEGYSFITFPELKQEMVKLSSENLFAKKFVRMSESVQYDKFDKVRRMAFDSYLKLLFRHNAAIEGKKLGKFMEAWKGEYKKFKTSVLLLKPERKQFEFYNDKIDFFDVRYDGSNGEISQKNVYGSIFKNKNNRFIYFVDPNSTADLYVFSRKKYSIGKPVNFTPVRVFKVLNVKRKLNKMLAHNKKFINFIISYRDDVYVPALKVKAEEQEKLERQQKEEQEELERQQKEEQEELERQQKIEEERLKMPRIGMTAFEVEKTRWGHPNKINRDTYSWGITEQWVYNDWGYVYFENGIVTSVSER